MELTVERLVWIDQANSDEYLKVLEDLSIEREELDKRITKAYKYAPAELRQIMTENLSSESDKIKIRLDLKPEPLHHNTTPVEYRVWTKDFGGSKPDKSNIIEQQQVLLKLLDIQLAAKLRGIIDDKTTIFPTKQQAC